MEGKLLLKLELLDIYNQYLSEIESDNKSKYQEKNPGKYYRASSAGHCYKKHWYAMNNVEGKEIPKTTKRLFRLGTIVHDDIQKAINWYDNKISDGLSNEYSVSLQTEYGILIEKLNVMGSADIILIDSEKKACVIDIKTMGWRAWSKRVSKNKSINSSPKYELQLGTYALGILEQEDIEYDDISLYLVYYKKDDSVMKSVEVNNIWMDNAAEYWTSLNDTLSFVKEEADLPRGTTNVPVEDWECNYCQFELICN